MYKVIAEMIEVSAIDSKESMVDRQVTDFSDYIPAIDYYEKTFSDVSRDICHIGGEFVITMLHNNKIVKRHLVSTTVNNEQD